MRQISIKGYNSPSLPIYNFISAEEIAIYQRNKDTLKSKEEKETVAEKQ